MQIPLFAALFERQVVLLFPNMRGYHENHGDRETFAINRLYDNRDQN